MNGQFFAVDVSSFTVFFIVLEILLIFGLFITIFSFNFSIKRNKKKYLEEHNSSFYYIINLRTQKVLKYNSRDLSVYKNETFVDFLSQFSSEEQNNVKNWLIENLNKDDFDRFDKCAVGLFTFADVKLNTLYKKIALKIVAVDQNDELIYLETTKLSNFPTNDYKNKKRVEKISYDLGEIKKSYEDGFFAKGSSYIISFQKKESVESIFNESFVKLLILDGLYSVLDKNNVSFYFKNPSRFEIGLLDKGFVTVAQTKANLKKIYKKINETMEGYGLLNFYKYTVVGGIVSDFSHSFDTMYNSLYQYIGDNFDKKLDCTLYRKEENLNNALDNVKNEFHSIISRRGIEANYRSIVQVKEDRILNYGYFVNFKVKSNVFKNIEMLKKAGKQFNQCKGILSLCMKECVPPYYNARENYFSKLIIPINYDELDATLDQATRITHLNESHIVFLLDINEFLDIEDLNIAYQTIKKVQLKGYEVGLLIREGEFQVKKELYEAIDMFFVDCELEENVKADSKSFINAHALLEKLVSYKKPIIEINARSFSEIELIYRSGIQYFSSDIIQSFSPMITPLDKKTIKKLVNIAK